MYSKCKLIKFVPFFSTHRNKTLSLNHRLQEKMIAEIESTIIKLDVTWDEVVGLEKVKKIVQVFMYFFSMYL